MSKAHKIAVIAGDGTGPEVIREGLKVLEAASKIVGFKYSVKQFDYGAEHFLKTKEVLSDFALEEFGESDYNDLSRIIEYKVDRIFVSGFCLNYNKKRYESLYKLSQKSS